MYEEVMETMERHGLEQYEISNFAKPGYESRHNLTYWNNEEYYRNWCRGAWVYSR